VPISTRNVILIVSRSIGRNYVLTFFDICSTRSRSFSFLCSAIVLGQNLYINLANAYEDFSDRFTARVSSGKPPRNRFWRRLATRQISSILKFVRKCKSVLAYQIDVQSLTCVAVSYALGRLLNGKYAHKAIML